MASSLLRFTHAIIRGIPNSFCEHAVRKNKLNVIDLEKARQQLKTYVQNLKACGVQVLELASDESQPDCVYVEDTAVAVGSRVLLTHMGHPNRRKEVS